MKLYITDDAKDYIIEHGFDPIYGARPLKRYMQSHVETMIARMILSTDIEINSQITVDVDRTSSNPELRVY